MSTRTASRQLRVLARCDAAKAKRSAADLNRYPLDPPGYAERVRELENEGLCTSDAQGVADVEFADRRAARRRAVRARHEAWL